MKPHHPRMHCAKFGIKWLNGSWEEDLKVLSMYFCYFVIISLWNKAWPFNPLHQRMLYANWSSSSWEYNKMWNVYDNENNNEDDQRTNYDQPFGSDELKSNNFNFYMCISEKLKLAHIILVQRLHSIIIYPSTFYQSLCWFHRVWLDVPDHHTVVSESISPLSETGDKVNNVYLNTQCMR